jgi:DNA-binding transcriptional LysR family regulator
MAGHLRPEQLRALSEIVRRGSFSRAAEALGLSQPAVSLQIQQLERVCGVALLERIGKRAMPTDAARDLLLRAEPALAELDAAVQALQQRGGEIAARVRLGAGSTASTYLLPAILGALRKQHPGLEITLVTDTPAGLAAAVVDNTLDVALVALPVVRRSLSVTPVHVDRLVGIAPPDFKRRTLTPAELARHPLVLFERRNNIRWLIETWFRTARVRPRVVMDLGNIEAVKKMVMAGIGLSIVPAIAVNEADTRNEPRVVALTPPLSRRLAVIRRRDKPVSPALSAVLATLAPPGGLRI